MGLLSDMLDAAKALDQPEKVAPLGDDARRERIVYGGRCQGVGFRWTSQSIARRLGLTGWVRNLEDGTVEMELQGPDDGLGEFQTRLLATYSGRGGAAFTIREKDILPLVAGEKEFSVKF